MEISDGCFLSVFACICLLPLTTSGPSLYSPEVRHLSSLRDEAKHREQSKTPDDQRGGGHTTRIQLERQILENELLNRYRYLILHQLGLPDNRTDFRVPNSTSGGEEMANRTMELIRLYDERSQQSEIVEGVDGRGGGGGGVGKTPESNRATIRTVLFGEKVSNSTDDDVVLFKLSKNQSRDFLVTGATVSVLVQPSRTGSSSSKPEAERLTIKIFALSGNASGNYDNAEKITELTLLTKKRQLQRLLLPTSFVQDAIDSQKESLLLKIACDRCVKPGEDQRPAKLKALRSKRRNERPQTRSLHPMHGVEKQHRERHVPLGVPYLTINSRRRPLRSKARLRNRLSPNKSVV